MSLDTRNSCSRSVDLVSISPRSARGPSRRLSLRVEFCTPLVSSLVIEKGNERANLKLLILYSGKDLAS